MNDNIKSQLQFRQATMSDVHHIVRLLADDNLGNLREQFAAEIPSSYYQAFATINADQNNWLIVVELDKQVIGTMQLTYITYMTYQGGKRAQIEGVRIDKSVRSQGIGQAMFEWVMQKAKADGCHLVQLTTDKRRPEAIKFYENLGFSATHEGMKLAL